MSFDARSLERLQQLGRSLPKPLPKPEAPKPATRATEQRHRVETETDPEALFHELIKVSPDGTVPPHLLDRLRSAEEERRQGERERQRQALRQQAGAQLGSRAAPATSSGQATDQRAAARQGSLRANPKRPKPSSDQELELYSTFQQLLLEGEGDD
ncbi:hypothetical protein [Vulcanococcus limneticus]|uniref:hypothetical protein n=1 Tax=Vulcanococcus limneticus TaxID=2170428 RepID=UPI00398C1E5C